MTTTKRDWIRTIGITGATLITLGALTMGGLYAANATGVITLACSWRSDRWVVAVDTTG
jgi:hypothetical protein